MNIKYTGPARDYSGYGEANRHDIAALVAAGVMVKTQIPSYTLELSDYGRLGELASSLEDIPLDYRIQILHTTPNVYKQYMEPGKYHIGRAFWETDKVPLDFAENLNLMAEIWTGSEFNAQAMRNAGVTKPIYIIPEAIDATLDIAQVQPYITVDTDCFKFYSMFEWTERKNPNALLEAFWTEFQNGENVSLNIKTYVDNFTPEKKREVRQMIRAVKMRLKLSTYPNAYIYTNLMDRHQVYRFHKTFDCFVSAHRGEGWGIPQMEAMLMGKPIISTNCGGIHEHLTNEEDSILLPYKLVQLKFNNRNRQWYTPDQNWAEVDLQALRKAMRYAYENQGEMSLIGRAAHETVLKKFDLPVVGKLMRERLEIIESAL